MPVQLYNSDGHLCLMFTDLSGPGSAAVPANPCLIVDGDAGAIIDPGGNVGFNELYLGLSRHLAPQRLTDIFALHADPDIIASLDRWMTATLAKVHVSTLWERFAPHFCKAGKTEGHNQGTPDSGARFRIGRGELRALPAHFMHAEGNLQFWDPESRILFSGDLGVSLGGDPQQPITSLKQHLPSMEPFSSALHGQRQDPSLLGPDGEGLADRHPGAAARRPVVRPWRSVNSSTGCRP